MTMTTHPRSQHHERAWHFVSSMAERTEDDRLNLLLYDGDSGSGDTQLEAMGESGVNPEAVHVVVKEGLEAGPYRGNVASLSSTTLAERVKELSLKLHGVVLDVHGPVGGHLMRALYHLALALPETPTPVSVSVLRAREGKEDQFTQFFNTVSKSRLLPSFDLINQLSVADRGRVLSMIMAFHVQDRIAIPIHVRKYDGHVVSSSRLAVDFLVLGGVACSELRPRIRPETKKLLLGSISWAERTEYGEKGRRRV